MTKKTMDTILILLGVAILLFTIVMVWLYLITVSIPDTLCTCFFVACTGECGFMGWIKTAKTRYLERDWQLEDEKRLDEKLKAKKEDQDGSI